LRACVTDTKIIQALFRFFAQSVDVVHFDVKKDLLRLRSIDPHDFCYVDATLSSSFFKEYFPDKEYSFTIETSRLANILHLFTAEKVFIEIADGFIDFSTKERWKIAVQIKWLRSDAFSIPEPREFDYDAVLHIKAEEFAEIVQKAMGISHELLFIVDPPNNLMISAVKGDYSFIAKPNVPYFEARVKQPVSSFVFLDYLKQLRSLMGKCDLVKIFIGNNNPLRLDLIYKDQGIFSFFFSQKKREKVEIIERENRGGKSLPRISMSMFEKYLIQLSKYPEGMEPQLLSLAGLDTKGNDCLRLSNMIAFTYKDKGKIKLTPLGEAFASLFEKSREKAKQFLHLIAKESLTPYRVMTEKIKTPIPLEDLKEQVNQILERDYGYKIDEQDFNTLLEIAKWCGVLSKKANLVF